MRIMLDDNAVTSIVKLAEGNPGAAVALGEMCSVNDAVDPATAPGGGIIKLCYLDDWEIYGSHIHILFKDVCKCSAPRFIALLRGVQLGHLRQNALKEAAETGQPSFDPDAIWRKVCEEIPNFMRPQIESGAS